MKKAFTIALTLAVTTAFGQNFEKMFRIATPFALNSSKIQWVDADNDSLLDVMIANTIQGEVKFSFFKNSGNNSFNLIQAVSSGYQSGIFFLTDFNSDNKIDFVISGKSSSGTEGTEVFLNNGNFNFQKSSTKILNQAFTEILFTDLNNDGPKDLIASNANGLYLYEQRTGQFILRMDTAIRAISIKSFDFDNNGFHDVVFSGLNSSNQNTTAALLLKDRFKILKRIQVSSINGIVESSDLNHDGLFDMVLAGKNSAGSQVIQIFKNNFSSFVLIRGITGMDSLSMRIADFTSDGKADISFLGKNNANRVSWIKTFTGDSVSVPAANVKVQDYGDYDRDGDLDLVQLRSDSILFLTNNLNTSNNGPSCVINSFGVQIYNRTFFYWPKSIDDHTDSTALTYDLKVFDNAIAIVASEFDETTRKRLLVSHGNLGTANYSIQKIIGTHFYKIQSIDNSFTTINEKVGSGTCSVCVNLAMQDITICDSTKTAQLKPHAPKAMWFSFSRGFLGIHDSLSYNLSDADTVFSFNPSSNPSCSNIKLFNIKASSTDTVKITKNLWNCEGSQNVLTVESEWLNVTWKNNLSSTVSNGNQLTTTLQKPIVFKATGSNKQGCQLKETFNLMISKPSLQLESNQYQILKGSSVQLGASGGSSYSWSPASSLDNPTSASPMASPISTTEYTVVAKDSLGCSQSGKVLIEIMEAGFIPTLFTPNGDGKNDELKIFGLSTASNFRFTIYNREGNIVFDTKDVSTASHQGWSGSSNGQAQPSGTYFWKIEGNNNLGETLTLNGKRAGAILLIR